MSRSTARAFVLSAGSARAALAAAAHRLRPRSLRWQLLLGLLLPIGLYIAINTVALYHQTLMAMNTAYDRTLLASAKSIGEQIEVSGYDAQARLRATLPYSALEAFEADNQSRLFYRVSSLTDETVSGFDDLPRWTGRIPDQGPYAALVDFYDDRYRSDDVRVAVLMQPVVSADGRGMAVIQVAETLELRRARARQLLHDTLARQAVLIAVITLVTVVVVQRATRPVRRLSDRLRERPATDLRPIAAPDAPRELHPLLDATNQVMAQLQALLTHQKRFVRDASHQLRTPLAVLRTQVQSARRGDLPAAQALEDIDHTVERATRLANQMLALARVEQLRQQADAPVLDLGEVVRGVALELSPLIAERDIDFAIALDKAPVQAHEWMLRELTRNLLHNAVRHSPRGAELQVTVWRRGVGTAETRAELCIQDNGPGIDPDLRQRLFQPFSAGDVRSGSGLGLAICHEIVAALAGTITLDSRPWPPVVQAAPASEHDNTIASAGQAQGLCAVVSLPLAHNPAG